MLTGAVLNLNAMRTQTTVINSTDGPNSGSNNPVTSTDTGSSNARISAPGVTNTFSVLPNQNASCVGSRQGGCVGTPASTGYATNAALNVSGGGLNAYVGAGTVTVVRTAPSITANQTNAVFTGNETTTFTLNWAGNLSAMYTYLLHAAPSFDGASLVTLNLDSGTVFLGDVAELDIGIYNNVGDRTGLDLTGISAGAGDTGKLTHDINPFTGLGPGLNNMYLASLDTSSVGAFAAGYLLTFADDATVGASASRMGGYTLTLNLTGNVVAPPTIPGPGMLALLGIGLPGAGLSRRKRA